jgi:hypothetical protein
MSQGQELTPLGWIMLVGSWSAITAAVIYCFYKVLRGGGGPEEDD